MAVPADAQRFRYRYMVLPRALQRPDTLATRHAGRISRAARRHPRVLGQASSHTCSCFFMFSRTCQARTCPPVTCLLMCATLLQAGRVACIYPSSAAARAARGWGQRRPSSPHTRATRERAGEYSRMRRHAAVLDAVECRRLEAPFGRRHLVRRIHAQVRTWRTRQEGVILGAIIRTDACRGGFKCTILSNGFLYDRFHTRIIKHSLNYNFNLIFIYIGKGTY